MSYAIFFIIDNMTLRLPTNPEEFEIDEGQDIEEFEILKLGKIAVPGTMKLKEYSFEVEFPKYPTSYTLTNNDYKEPSFYIDIFRKAREDKKHFRMIVSNGILDISELVLIESLKITEKSGEEGDYYIGFTLKQYKPYELKEVKVQTNTNTIQVTNQTARASNPPAPTNNTHVVQNGETLWSIAKKYLGDGSRYNEIHKINQPPLTANPNIIKVGQKLTIPKG